MKVDDYIIDFRRRVETSLMLISDARSVVLPSEIKIKLTEIVRELSVVIDDVEDNEYIYRDEIEKKIKKYDEIQYISDVLWEKQYERISKSQ